MNGLKLLSDLFANVPADEEIVKGGGRIGWNDTPNVAAEVSEKELAANNALCDVLKGFIGGDQLKVLRDMFRGEEREFFFDKILELAAVVEKMPLSTEDGEAPAVLHYFAGGQANWYITHKDVANPDDAEHNIPLQSQAFGLADLFGDGGEVGYISIAEIISNNGELDFHWTPRSLKQIRSGRDDEEQSEAEACKIEGDGEPRDSGDGPALICAPPPEERTEGDTIRSALNVPSYDFADPEVQKEAARLIEERGLMALVMTTSGTCHIVQGYVSPTRIGEFRRLSECQATGLWPNQLKADSYAARCYLPAPAGPKSYKSELYVEGSWSSNSMRYATEREASHAGGELMSRWMVPTDRRVAPSDDPVNARFNFGTYKSEPIEHAPTTSHA